MLRVCVCMCVCVWVCVRRGRGEAFHIYNIVILVSLSILLLLYFFIPMQSLYPMNHFKCSTKHFFQDGYLAKTSIAPEERKTQQPFISKLHIRLYPLPPRRPPPPFPSSPPNPHTLTHSPFLHFQDKFIKNLGILMETVMRW